MIRLLFERDFDWQPPERPRVVIAYRGGIEYGVRRLCAEAALAAGVAQLVARSRVARPTETNAPETADSSGEGAA